MKTMNKQITTKALSFMIMWLIPAFIWAQHTQTATEEAEANAKVAMYSEIAIGVLFVGAVVAFLVYKSKHDKKVRQQQLEQMQRVQAAKRKAA